MKDYLFSIKLSFVSILLKLAENLSNGWEFRFVTYHFNKSVDLKVNKRRRVDNVYDTKYQLLTTKFEFFSDWNKKERHEK